MKLLIFVLCAFVFTGCLAQNCLNIAECKQNPPIYELPLDENGQYPLTVADIDNGSTTTCEPLSLSLRNAPVNNIATCNSVDLIPPYPLTLILVANGASGSPSICFTRFEVVDEIPPIAVCKQNIKVGSNALITGAMIDGGSSDNCGIKTRFANVTSVGPCDNLIPVKLIVSDHSNNTASCETFIEVVDSVAPIAKCKNSIQNVGATGSVTIEKNQADSLVNDGSYDICDGTDLTIQFSFDEPITRTCDQLGNSIVTLQAIDSKDNTGSCNANVIFVDQTSPNAICSDTITVDVGAQGFVTLTGEQLAGNSTDVCGVATYGSSATFYCDDIDSELQTTSIIKDFSGNSASCNTNIMAVDRTPPEAECVTSYSFNVGSGSYELCPSEIDENSWDTCSYEIFFALSKSEFECSDVGTSTVTLTVTDDWGNSANCSTPLNIKDETKPTAVCKSSITIDVGQNGVYTLNPSDGYLLDDGSSDTCTAVTTTLNIPRPDVIDCGRLGTRPYNLIVKDAYGNTASCPSSINFVDSTPPTESCITSTSINVGDGRTHFIAASTLMTGTTDACGVEFSESHPFSCANLGPQTVTSRATDPSNNYKECETVVDVVDFVPPVPKCIRKPELNVGQTGMVAVTIDNIDDGSFDACSTATLEISSPLVVEFTCDDIAEHDFVLQVTDESGNEATCNSEVQIVDRTPPSAACGTYTADVGSAPGGIFTINTFEADVLDNESSDVCSGTDLSFSIAAPVTGSCQTLGSKVVELFVTDKYDNTASCTATVVFVDQTKPEVSCGTQTLEVGSADASPNLKIVATAYDVCGFLDYSTNDPTVYGCEDIGNSVPIDVTVKDASDNEATCTGFLDIVDLTPPVLACDSIFTAILNEDGYIDLDVDDFASATDRCDVAPPTLTLDKSHFVCDDIGTRFATTRASDVYGNSAICLTAIKVVDETIPQAVCKDVTIEVGNTPFGTVTLSTEMGYLANDGSTDNCGVASVSFDKTYTGSCTTLFEQTANLVVKDGSNNVDTCESTINFVDTIPPTIQCRAQLTVDVGRPFTIDPKDAVLTYFDVCDVELYPVTFTSDVTELDCSAIGKTVVEITATDFSLNEAKCVTTFIGEDQSPPDAYCLSNVEVDIGDGIPYTLLPETIDDSSVDFCGGPLTYSLNQTIFTCADVGKTVNVALQVSDEYLNSAVCVGSLNLIDEVKPKAHCKDTVRFELSDHFTGRELTALDIDLGSYDDCSKVTLSIPSFTINCANVGTNPIELTVTDEFGNFDTCTTDVEVVDITPPRAICNNIRGSGAITPANVDGGSTDNCGAVTLSVNPPTIPAGSDGGLVTLTATDQSGNINTCVASITIQFGELLTAPSEISEHIPFTITWTPGESIPEGTIATLSLINTADPFYYLISDQVPFHRGKYVVSGGISGVTTNKDYLIVLSVPTDPRYGSSVITVTRFPTNQ